MVGEVITSEGVDQLGITADVGEGDRDDLTITCRGGGCGGTLEQFGRVRREQCRGDKGRHIGTGLGPLDDRGDRGGVADCELMDHVVGFGRHSCSIDATADTGLTRRTAHTLLG